MTDRGTSATYRHIGDHEQAGSEPARPGLRRIGEHRQPPEPPPRELTEEAVAAEPEGQTVVHEPEARATPEADEWSGPHPDELEDGDTRLTDTEPAEEAPATAKAPKARRRSRAAAAARSRFAGVRAMRGPLLAVSAVAVLLAAAVVVLSVLYVQSNSRESMRSSALSAAHHYGVLLSSYDYRNLTGPTSDWTKVEQASTPAFRKNFLSTSADLGKLLTQYNAVATGKVLNAGIESLSGNRAVILLFIDQTVNNTVQKGQGTTQPLRSQLTLVHQGGKWLIDDLQVPK